jgi:hypothetical protein
VSERLELRAGETVEVRSAAEILATLDHDAATGGLPFMPEMVPYVGRRLVVTAQAVKVCDTTGGRDNLRLDDTVILDDLRCDGSAHGGCQAGCRLFWRSSWLRRPATESAVHCDIDEPSRTDLESRAGLASTGRSAPDLQSTDTYRCQATELVAASHPITRRERFANYLDELRFRNVGPWRFLRVLARAVSRKLARQLGRHGSFPLRSLGKPGAYPPLNLRPGELVRVKTQAEILQALDSSGRYRGLTFDWEMLPHCGKTYRVKERVERIVNERTGEMIHIASDCIILDGVSCSGDWSQGRWFCPRAVYPYWREAWLARVDDNSSGSVP